MILQARSNADLDAGFSVKSSITGDPVPLTGAVPWMQIRTKAGGTVIYDSLNTDHFTVDEAAGTIALSIPKAVVETWDFHKAEFDIILTYQPAGRKPFVSGIVEFEIGVTDD